MQSIQSQTHIIFGGNGIIDYILRQLIEILQGGFVR